MMFDALPSAEADGRTGNKVALARGGKGSLMPRLDGPECECHCEDVGLRERCDEPAFDSENGHLISLRTARAV
jgi:hypothetical protein